MNSLVSSMSDIKSKYRTFIAVPRKFRPKGLKTTKDFAQHFGLHPATLLQWEQEPGFAISVFAEAQAVLSRSLADIMQALADRAMEGSVAAIKLSLEVLGVHHDKMEIQHHNDSDQIILVLPPGMTLPGMGEVKQLKSANDPAEEIVTHSHISDDMIFVLDGDKEAPSVDPQGDENPVDYDIESHGKFVNYDK